MNRIPVALFHDRAEAEPIRQRLAQAGIPAEIHDELRLEKLWLTCKEDCGVRLEVPANQFERAEDMLIEWDRREGALRDAIHCPECHSLRVDYPQFTRKSLLTNLAMGIAANVGVVEKEYYCEDCHLTWPREGAKPHRDRGHMAPYYFIEDVDQTDVRRHDEHSDPAHHHPA
jgi:Putative prokaryotic signal transducing protein